MPKKKRTRKDKIDTDVRRQSSSKTDIQKTSAPVARATEESKVAEKPSIGTFSLPMEYASIAKKSTVKKNISSPKAATINTTSYSYLRGDLVKTSVLTIAIVTGELLIYFTMMK